MDFLLNWFAHGLLNFSWWQVALYTLVVTQITIAGVTLYLHRCQAHRALDLHPIVSHFFRFWLWYSSGMVTKEWSAIHRKHHAKCEGAEDPHSPVTHGIKTVLLEGSELYRAEAKNLETLDKYGHGTPDDWIERNLYTKHSIMGVYLCLAVNVLLLGAIGISVFAIQMLWIPVHAAGIINGIGHFWGYRNFDAPDASRNITPIAFWIGGEELHNNHHAYGTSAKFSNKWYEFDIGWMYIVILRTFGLATVRKVAPKPKFTAIRNQIDLDNLQAVIHHRYDMMAVYAKSIRKECQAELKRLAASAEAAKHSDTVESARRWLHIEGTRWPEAQKAKLAQFLETNERLKQMVQMREELAQVWERSSVSREQLVAQLQEWCHRAEASGSQALQLLSQRVRSYAV